MKSLDKKGNVIDEVTPHLLMYCTRFLPKNTRKEFPIIDNLELHATKWKTELQIFKDGSLFQLNEELIRIRKLANMEEFIDGVDNNRFLKHWKGDDTNVYEFYKYLDAIQNVLQKAITQKLEVRIYL